MNNQYERISDGIIAIYCHGSDLSQKIYIDEEDFEKVKSYNVTWGLWKNRNSKDNYTIGASIKTKNGKRKAIYMKRIITDCEEKVVYLVNDSNWFDLRKQNLMVERMGAIHSNEFKTRKKQLLKTYTKVLDPSPCFLKETQEIEKDCASSGPDNLLPEIKVTHILGTNKIYLVKNDKWLDISYIGENNAKEMGNFLNS